MTDQDTEARLLAYLETARKLAASLLDQDSRDLHEKDLEFTFLSFVADKTDLYSVKEATSNIYSYAQRLARNNNIEAINKIRKELKSHGYQIP